MECCDLWRPLPAHVCSDPNGLQSHSLSHSVLQMDVTHPFRQRKRRKKQREPTKSKTMTTVQAKLCGCSPRPGDFAFPANIGESEGGQQPITHQHPPSYPSIQRFRSSTPPLWASCPGDVGSCEWADWCPGSPYGAFSSPQGAVCTRNFPTGPLGNQQASVLKLGKTERK